MEIADSFSIELSKPIKPFSTRYPNNIQDSKFVLDLVFLYPNLREFDNHHIYPYWRLTSDHIPITVNILILEEQVQEKIQLLPKNSKEEEHFINELINYIKSINTQPISNVNTLETIIQSFASNINKI